MSAEAEPPLRSPNAVLGLRSLVTALFAAGALLVSVALSVGTNITARTYLMEQMRIAAKDRAFQHALEVRSFLLEDASGNIQDKLAAIQTRQGGVIFVYYDGQWIQSSKAVSPQALDENLREIVMGEGATQPAYIWAYAEQLNERQKVLSVVTGTPIQLNGQRAYFFELDPMGDLERTLQALPVVLAVVAALTTLAGALVGSWASKRVLTPLHDVASATTRVSEGDMHTRLPESHDPDLKPIVDSFNAMVDAIDNRIERERRFTADVSHELRSPLTALTTAVHLLQSRQDELPERAQKAVQLMDTELQRFSQALSDLLEISRLESGTIRVQDPVFLPELIRQTLNHTNRDLDLFPDKEVPNAPEERLTVVGDKGQLHRAIVNLLQNADKYGDGPKKVSLTLQPTTINIHVDDAGSGVAPEERERIFNRFVRSGSRRSIPGTGLGLSLVAETAAIHGGSVVCTDSPLGGARFTITLPIAPVDPVES